MYSYTPKVDDCPNCGKEEAARMGSTRWGHMVSCCSNECGEEVAKKIRANENRTEYKEKLKRYYNIQTELQAMRLEGIDTDHEPFYDL
jgi:ribosomal protein L37AE/L43A